MLLTYGNSLYDTGQCLFAKGEIEVLFRHCQRERGAALEPFGELREPLEVHRIQFQRI
jgi:hypothetical protein